MVDARIGQILGSEDETARGERIRGGFFSTLRRAARHIPFIDELIAAYFCAFDPKTPRRVRAMLLAALAYFVLPTDTIPDFLIGFGFTDDATVLLSTITLLRNHINETHRAAARRVIEEGPGRRARRFWAGRF